MEGREIEILKMMGVEEFRLFYLATIGYLVHKLTDQQFVTGTSVEALEKAASDTEKIEVMHVMAAPPMFIKSLADLVEGRTMQGSIGLLLNTVINVYPIMMQRYNRKRIQDILDRKLDTRDEN